MYQRILVPFDGSDASLHGLDEAVRVGMSVGATLEIVHVADHFYRRTGFTSDDTYMKLLGSIEQEGQALLAQGCERAERAGVKVESKLLALLGGRISDVVVEEARDWEADLIVVGTRGRRGIERMLWGSDAQEIMGAAPVPVLLVQAARPPATKDQ
ncbi:MULTISPECIES: universal stress protein [unclassified Variovorax]|uniref:universal stress protein n=1 Tax=unclassified Variovorax TaxID=663243 RepID=UPI001BD2110D|nr:MULTISPECIES: universal stress protein [unclassified Variovorax]